MTHRRYPELDSLRGLASLAVFFSHVVGMAQLTGPAWQYVGYSMAHVLWDGSAAVVFFFVLSGFVLLLPFAAKSLQWQEIPGFWIRRIFRIYPAYVVVIFFVLLIRGVLYSPETVHGMSDWFSAFWRSSVSLKEVVMHLVMIGPSFDTHKIDPVIWSLLFEMKVSLIFPMVIFLLVRIKKMYVSGAIILGFIAASRISGKDTLAVLSLFVMGGSLALYGETIVSFFRRRSRKVRVVLGLLGLALYSSRYSIGALDSLWGSMMTDFLIGLGAIIIIISALSSERFGSFLRHPHNTFLGRISYSFYLLHLPILLVCVSMLGRIVTSPVVLWWTSAPAALTLSLLLSNLCYKYIEVPFVRLGRSTVSLIPASVFPRERANVGA